MDKWKIPKEGRFFLEMSEAIDARLPKKRERQKAESPKSRNERLRAILNPEMLKGGYRRKKKIEENIKREEPKEFSLQDSKTT